METHAYPNFYLPDAKRHLGSCTDYIVHSYGWTIPNIGQAFANSNTLEAFGRGDPSIIAGLSGIELAHRIVSESGDAAAVNTSLAATSGRSPEYWTGWALAQLQWHLNRPFSWILKRCPLATLCGKYAIYHEMDIARLTEDVIQDIKDITFEPNLRRFRRAAGLSQSQLAIESGVNLRSIQLYEQRVQNINRASAESLRTLAKCLSCSIEDLMEDELSSTYHIPSAKAKRKSGYSEGW